MVVEQKYQISPLSCNLPRRTYSRNKRSITTEETIANNAKNESGKRNNPIEQQELN